MDLSSWNDWLIPWLIILITLTIFVVNSHLYWQKIDSISSESKILSPFELNLSISSQNWHSGIMIFWSLPSSIQSSFWVITSFLGKLSVRTIRAFLCCPCFCCCSPAPVLKCRPIKTQMKILSSWTRRLWTYRKTQTLSQMEGFLTGCSLIFASPLVSSRPKPFCTLQHNPQPKDTQKNDRTSPFQAPCWTKSKTMMSCT